MRNEIVHYLPRPTSTLLLPLERRGLLMSTPRASNWDVAQKLASYALAHWAFETVEGAVKQLVSTAPNSFWAKVSLAENYSLFRERVCPPAQLREFDAHHGLTLTEDDASE